MDAAVDTLEHIVQGALPTTVSDHHFLPSNTGALARAREARLRASCAPAAASAPVAFDFSSDAPSRVHARQYGGEDEQHMQLPPPNGPHRVYDVPYALPPSPIGLSSQQSSHPSSPGRSSNASLSASSRAVEEGMPRSPSPCHV